MITGSPARRKQVIQGVTEVLAHTGTRRLPRPQAAWAGLQSELSLQAPWRPRGAPVTPRALSASSLDEALSPSHSPGPLRCPPGLRQGGPDSPREDVGHRQSGGSEEDPQSAPQVLAGWSVTELRHKRGACASGRAEQAPFSRCLRLVQDTRVWTKQGPPRLWAPTGWNRPGTSVGRDHLRVNGRWTGGETVGVGGPFRSSCRDGL